MKSKNNKKKFKPEDMLRLSVADPGPNLGKSVGRIPHELAQIISPLIDQNYIYVEGISIDDHEQLAVISRILISLKVYLKEEAFDRPSKVLNAEEDLKNTEGKKCLKILLEKLNKSESISLEKDEDPQKLLADTQMDSLYARANCQNINLEEFNPGTIMKCELRPYQKQALTWMLNIENGGAKLKPTNNDEIQETLIHPLWKEQKFDNHELFYWSPYSCELSLTFPALANTTVQSGILADEMGLGKTVEMLSVIAVNHPCYEYCNNVQDINTSIGEVCTTLIVCPLSLLSQWESEIKNHTRLKNAYIYYGQSRLKATKRSLDDYDIVLTTYQTLAADFNNTTIGPIFNIQWYRVVLDEAHNIKNRTTSSSKACTEVKALRRWALTGTPLQNRIDDLYAIIRFLKVSPWDSYSFWSTQISTPFEENDKKGLTNLQGVLEPLVLRRCKNTKDSDGNALVPLTNKIIKKEMIELTEHERDLYNAIFTRSQLRFSAFMKAGEIMQNYANILELLLRLRQCCDHPFLMIHTLKSKSKQTSKHTFSDIDKIMDTFLKHTQGYSDKLITDNPIDGPYDKENVNNLNGQGNKTSPKGKQNENNNDGINFALSIINDLKSGKLQREECPICLEPPDELVITPCLHTGCQDCMPGVIAQLKSCPVCRLEMAPEQLIIPPKEEQENNDNKNKDESDQQNTRSTLSSKLQKLFEDLEKLSVDYPNDKCVIFSQFTGMLNMVQDELFLRNKDFVRLDGSKSLSERSKVLRTFREFKNCKIILISLKAGGTGLNLTIANHVYMLDPWWNAAVEEQAMDRVHRIGQLKDVFITRYIISNSVEERILEIQENKKAMAHDALNSNEEERKAERMENLRTIFQLTG